MEDSRDGFYDDEEDLENEIGESEEEDDLSLLSSSPSIPDENIDFNFTYALHTFVATVEGQANCAKGETLTLLDDSNSYWWLVRVLKDQSIGYLPAEHIETPGERLARLNKYRNVEISQPRLDDQERPDIIKPSKFSLRRKKQQNKKTVVFGQNTFVEHPGLWSDLSDNELEEEGDYDEEEEAGHLVSKDDGESRIVSEEVNPEDGGDDFVKSNTKTSSTHAASASHHSQIRASESDIYSDSSQLGTKKFSLTPAIAQDSRGSAVSEGQTASGAREEIENQEKKKKHSVFGALFKKKTRKEKEPSTIEPVGSRITNGEESTNHEVMKENSKQDKTEEDLHNEESDNVGASDLRLSKLPRGVQEMRNSQLMDIDPIPEHKEDHAFKGPVDEVEMLHERSRLSTSQETEHPNLKELRRSQRSRNHPVWSQQALQEFLEDDDSTKRLVWLIRGQAHSRTSRQNQPLGVESSCTATIEEMLTKLNDVLDLALNNHQTTAKIL